MSQKMLNSLAIISIYERELVKNLDYEIWIKNLSKNRKENFCLSFLSHYFFSNINLNRQHFK